jgi:hypothetical protein
MLQNMSPQQLAAFQRMIQESSALTAQDEQIKRQREMASLMRNKALGPVSPGVHTRGGFVAQSPLAIVQQALAGYYGRAGERKAGHQAGEAAGKRGTMRGDFLNSFMGPKPEDVGGL